MIELNRYKLNLYELLYTYPLCSYRVNRIEQKGTGINVVFVGDLDKAIETYKTLFWASQYPECILRMTYAGCDEDIEHVKSVFNDKDKFPALEKYVSNGYAEELHYCHDSVGELKELLGGEYIYTYTIIATGDAERDFEYAAFFESIYDSDQELYKMAFIATYNDGLNNKFAMLDREKIARNVVLIQFEKSTEECEHSELRRLAANINLAYNIKYDERLNIEQNFKEFEMLCQEEFADFDSDQYSADSSYASAVHISSKLAYCLEYSGKDIHSGQEIALKILATAIENDSELFKKLYYYEHKRWNAYMVMRGYKYPEKEEWSFVYNDGIGNVDVKNKLHVCLCESGEELNQDMNKSSFWKKWKDRQNPLDYASYRCNKVVNFRTKKLEKRIWNDYPFLSGVLFEGLSDAIKDLFLGKKNADVNYKKEYTYAIKRPDVAVDSKIIDELCKLNDELKIVLIRNQHINFFAYDAQLVKLIPFSLWFKKYYKEVYIFSTGIAAKDVILPTLLYAHKAYFISDDGFEDKYKLVLQRYFRERGSNTESLFVNYEQLMGSIRVRTGEKIIITGEGHLKEKFLEERFDIINLRYDSGTQGIIGDNIFCGLEKQSFSVEEFVHLQGGDIQNVFRDHLSKKMFCDLEAIFWEFAKIKKDDEYTYYIPWNRGSAICNPVNIKSGNVQVSSNFIEISEFDKKHAYVCEETIRQDEYINKSLDQFLAKLLEICLIVNFSSTAENDNICIRFVTYHKEICDVIKGYSAQKEIVSRDMISFCVDHPTWDQRKMFEYRSNQYTVKKKNKVRNLENDLFQRLKEIGAVSNISYEDNVIKSVKISNAKIVEILEKEGNMFEKVTFHKMENSGFFDDVKNGVEFFWNAEAQNEMKKYILLKQEINKKADENILGLVDIETLCKIRNNIWETEPVKENSVAKKVKNEIDVICTRGMQAYFVSCKCTREVKKDYLYELSDLAKNAGAVPLFATCLTREQCSKIIGRAELENILIIAREELLDQGDFNNYINSKVFGLNS